MLLPHYILVSGKAENGKDVVAEFMKERLEQEGKKVYILHYADHLKEIARTFYNWDGEKDIYGRTLLQSLGDSDGRIKRNNNLYYVEHLITLIKYLLDKDDYVIIPDVRYPFEIGYVRDNLNPHDTMCTIRVTRRNFKSKLTEEQLQHESEIALDNYDEFDYYIANDILEQLKDNVCFLCDRILKREEC